MIKCTHCSKGQTWSQIKAYCLYTTIDFRLSSLSKSVATYQKKGEITPYYTKICFNIKLGNAYVCSSKIVIFDVLLYKHMYRVDSLSLNLNKCKVTSCYVIYPYKGLNAFLQLIFWTSRIGFWIVVSIL